MGALGLLPARPDVQIGSASNLVHCQVGRSRTIGPTIELGGSVGPLLPLGHQDTIPDSCCCPILFDDTLDERPDLALRLAAVAIAIDSQNRVLLTRRPRTMRTFPGAWVLPGGSADATDSSLGATAVRELQEETGLYASLPTVDVPFCLWESCYPVSYEGWRDARAAQARVAHSLIAFMLVPVSDEELRAPLKLQPGECDAACWVPLEEVAGALCSEGGNGRVYACKTLASESTVLKDGTTGVDGHVYASRTPASESKLKDDTVPASLLAGVYPNAHGEGIGRGHLFALRQLSLALTERGATAPTKKPWLE